MRSPILLLIRMNAAETSASSAIADWTPLTVVPRSLTTAEIDTFIIDVSITSTNIAIANKTASRELPVASSGMLVLTVASIDVPCQPCRVASNPTRASTVISRSSTRIASCCQTNESLSRMTQQTPHASIRVASGSGDWILKLGARATTSASTKDVSGTELSRTSAERRIRACPNCPPRGTCSYQDCGVVTHLCTLRMQFSSQVLIVHPAPGPLRLSL